MNGRLNRVYELRDRYRTVVNSVPAGPACKTNAGI
jgi:hypothetical protein